MGYFPAYSGPLGAQILWQQQHIHISLSAISFAETLKLVQFNPAELESGRQTCPPCGDSPAILVVKLARQGARKLGWTTLQFLYFR